MNGENYKEFIIRRRIWYKTIKHCYCPALKQNIVFNSKGFQHLLFDGLGHARSNKERVYRLKLLSFVVTVIKKCQKIHEYTKPTYSNKLGKNIEYWVLKESVNKQKLIVTVILRRIGDGNIIFYSVWSKQNKTTKKP